MCDGLTGGGSGTWVSRNVCPGDLQPKRSILATRFNDQIVWTLFPDDEIGNDFLVHASLVHAKFMQMVKGAIICENRPISCLWRRLQVKPCILVKIYVSQHCCPDHENVQRHVEFLLACKSKWEFACKKCKKCKKKIFVSKFGLVSGGAVRFAFGDTLVFAKGLGKFSILSNDVI